MDINNLNAKNLKCSVGTWQRKKNPQNKMCSYSPECHFQNANFSLLVWNHYGAAYMPGETWQNHGASRLRSPASQEKQHRTKPLVGNSFLKCWELRRTRRESGFANWGEHFGSFFCRSRKACSFTQECTKTVVKCLSIIRGCLRGVQGEGLGKQQ